MVEVAIFFLQFLINFLKTQTIHFNRQESASNAPFLCRVCWDYFTDLSGMRG